MARFLIRVELHDAEHGDQTYDHLHSEMDSAGFERTVTVNGKILALPPAEYTVDAKDDVTKETVYNTAKEAAKTALKKARLTTTPAIVVAELKGGLFVGGLEKA